MVGKLPVICRIGSILACRQVAHDAAQIDSVEPLAVNLELIVEAGHFIGVEPESRHRGVDMKGRGSLVLLSSAHSRHSCELRQAVDDRDHAVGREIAFLSVMATAEREYPCPKAAIRECTAKCDGLRQ